MFFVAPNASLRGPSLEVVFAARGNVNTRKAWSRDGVFSCAAEFGWLFNYILSMNGWETQAVPMLLETQMMD